MSRSAAALRPAVLTGVLLAACAVLVLPATGVAATTIGSDLNGSSGRATCEPDACTVVQLAIPGRQVTSPMDGVIVRWRIADSEGNFALRVVRQASETTGTATGTSTAVDVATT